MTLGANPKDARVAAITAAQLSLGQALLLAGLDEQGLQLLEHGRQQAEAKLAGWDDEALQRPGSVGLPPMQMTSPKRPIRFEQAEAAIGRYTSSKTKYPLDAMVTGALAWCEGDWMTVLMAYLESITLEPTLEDLWPRLEVAATRLSREAVCGSRDEEALKNMINRVVMVELTDAVLAALRKILALLPVEGQWREARDTTLARSIVVTQEVVRESKVLG